MFLTPEDLIRYLPLTPQKRVGDFGAGAGTYTETILDRLNGEGAVYAFDAFVPHIERMASVSLARNHTNLFPLYADLNERIPLADSLLDVALVVNTLHALHNRARFLHELHRVMGDGGAVLFSDWAASFKGMGPHEDAVRSPGEAVRLFQSHGFMVGAMLPAGTHHYAFTALKV